MQANNFGHTFILLSQPANGELPSDIPTPCRAIRHPDTARKAPAMMSEPIANPVGVCSWSLKVTSVPELAALVRELGVSLVQIACGDPHHAEWAEGDRMPAVARAADFEVGGAMIGFPGEDYATPESIHRTGGFGDPATRPERLELLKWALTRTRELGTAELMFHAGAIPPPGDPARRGFLDALATAARLAEDAGVYLAFETGQDRAGLVLGLLGDLASRHVGVNFDPANMLLYDNDDPHEALELLAPHIRSAHLKDANRPSAPGEWGAEVPLGRGQTRSGAFVRALVRAGYMGPLYVEREVGDQPARVADIGVGLAYLRGEGLIAPIGGAGKSRVAE